MPSGVECTMRGGNLLRFRISDILLLPCKLRGYTSFWEIVALVQVIHFTKALWLQMQRPSISESSKKSAETPTTEIKFCGRNLQK